VYLEAEKVVRHLQEAVEAAAIGIGNPQLQGAMAFLVVLLDRTRVAIAPHPFYQQNAIAPFLIVFSSTKA
jgi:hypothetical protein